MAIVQVSVGISWNFGKTLSLGTTLLLSWRN